MTIEILALGLVLLVGIVVGGALLGTVARANRPVTVDDNQPARTLRASRNLRYNGAWEEPRLSDHDKRILRR